MILSPKLQGGKKKDKSNLHSGRCSWTWRSFLPDPKSGIWSNFAWVRKNKLMWEASQCWEEFPTSSSPFPAHLYQRLYQKLISALSVQGEVLWVPKLMGQKENIISCGPYHSWSKSEKSPLLCLLPVRDKRASLGRVTAQGFH